MSTIKANNVNHPGYSENLKEEKYRLVRAAILKTLPEQDSGESMLFSDLEKEVDAFLKQKEVDPALFPKPGSVRWYTKTVQLDLEAREEIERLPGQSPIRLRKRAS